MKKGHRSMSICITWVGFVGELLLSLSIDASSVDAQRFETDEEKLVGMVRKSVSTVA